MAYSNPLSQYPSLEKQPVLEQYRVALSSYLFFTGNRIDKLLHFSNRN